MKIFTVIAVFVLCMTIQVVPTRAQDFLVQQHSIAINVESLEDALRQMSAMPGFELSSQISIADGWGSAVRMVQNRDLDRTLELLSELGNVTRAESSATNFFSQWAGLMAEFSVRNQEYDRMMELLHNATTIQQFTLIEHRLREIISHQEWIRGQLNSIEFEIGNARVHVALNLYIPAAEPIPDPEPEQVATGRLRIIGDTFLLSGSLTFAALQAVLVFLVRVSIPAIFLIFAGVVGLKLYRKRDRKDEKNEKIQIV